METLTQTGWKKIADVQPGERVMALTPEGVSRYEEVTAAMNFDFDGDLLETTNRSIRYSVTPNHKMVIRRQGYTGWQFCEAWQLDEYPRFPFDHEWEGVEREWVDLPPPTQARGVGVNQNSAPGLKADDYLELLGWYLSEGSAFLASGKRKASPTISIRQAKGCPEQLHTLMCRLPWRSRFREGDGYRIHSRQLYEHFKPFGTLYQKRVPRWVMDLSQRQLRLVFEAFTLGDGQKIDNGAIAFGLANEGLADDLQEIAAKLGYRSTKGIGKGGEGNRYDVYRLYVHARRGGVVQDKPYNKRAVPYQGKVYCLTVEPSHTMLVRHEGRVSWSGNSESQFFYMLSRNRSTCGIKPYVRATCNPDPGWLKVLLAPWVDKEFQGAKAASGELRYFLREEGIIRWVPEGTPDAKSLTFIKASIYDNKYLLDRNPDYLGNLKALPPIERARLLEGDWDVRREGLVYPHFPVSLVEGVPPHLEGKEPEVGGIDFGFHHPFAAVWGILDDDDVLWITGCRYKSNTTLPVHSEALPQGVRWWADPARPDLVTELRHADHEVLPCKHLGQKPVLTGIDRVSERLRTGRLKVVRSDCLPLIREFSLYTYDLEKNSEEPIKEDDHACDALRYLITGLDRGRAIPVSIPTEEERDAQLRAEVEQEKKRRQDLQDNRDIDDDRWWRWSSY